jgi:hypothetical protein
MRGIAYYYISTYVFFSVSAMEKEKQRHPTIKLHLIFSLIDATIECFNQ